MRHWEKWTRAGPGGQRRAVTSQWDRVYGDHEAGSGDGPSSVKAFNAADDGISNLMKAVIAGALNNLV